MPNVFYAPTFLFTIIISLFCCGQTSKLSPNATVSVLTFGPGLTLQDAFGHNAFRIKDTLQGIDEVYGYGEYDFQAPNFYLKFVLGKLNYKLSKHNYIDIYSYYSNSNRNIQEQVLNFSPSEKQNLYRILRINYLPQNRAYQYDFFFDNCATRIRNISQKAVTNKILFHPNENFKNKTFRTLIHEHVALNTWGSFGIDVALGSIIDRKASVKEYLFLPKYIYQFFDTATIGKNKPLVTSKTMVFQAKQTTSNLSFLWSPLMALSLLSLLIIYITYKDFKTQTRTKLLDILIFAITGVVGFVLSLLWVATEHTSTAYNYNLLWAFPFNVVLIFPLLKQKPKKWTKGYVKLLILTLFLMLLHALTGIQVFSVSLIPLGLALAVRYLFLVKVLD